jgi:hypothetical protein
VASTSSRRSRPTVPDFGLPGRVDKVLIPCAGRIQPEHVLKALEAGSDVVAIVACEEGNCHYSEGSRRCALRVEHIRSLVEEIGLGESRLVLAHLPGTAVEDMLLTAEPDVKTEPPDDKAQWEQKIGAVRDQVLEALRITPPNPLAASAKNVREPAGKKVAQKVKKEGGR